MHGTGCMVQDAGYSTRGKDAYYRMHGTECRAHDAGYRMQGTGCRAHDAGCRAQDAGYRMQDAGYRMQGAGYRMQGTGCRVQDAGYRLGNCVAEYCGTIQTEGCVIVIIQCNHFLTHLSDSLIILILFSIVLFL